MTSPARLKELNGEREPEKVLRAWAQAYRDSPQYRFPSDPDAEFFPADLDAAADTIERLTRVITRAQEAVATLSEDALGFGEDDGGRWPLRDELLHEIDAAIRNHKDGEGNV